ncbi:hypothetical protein PQX77_016351 [Marasmius sp. AFHP31]|nr:hypothetical protein PQX77_016351 [Marasmius sp. AFHP31]
MHHAQVDRLLSIWAALNPSRWVTPSTSEEGSWSIDQGSVIDEDTGLTPFWKDNSSLWTSAKMHGITTPLGYTYPDLNKPSQTPESEPTGSLSKDKVAEKITQLYAGATLNRLLSSRKTATGSQEAAAGPQDSAAEPTVLEWTARIHVKKYEVKGSFIIPLFLGTEVPEDPNKWLTSEKFVGAHYVFVNRQAPVLFPVIPQMTFLLESSTPENCGNCGTQLDNVTEGFVHFNDFLITHAKLETLEPEIVEPYLKDNLQWRAIKASGEEIKLSQLKSLKVEVTATRLSLPPGAKFPVAGKPEKFPEITKGKLEGGAGSAKV